ncbi:MAG: lamin tail domain-containing protein [Candidatus Thermoplasmatota archaeon]|nr:lamin tail domain-containing protein [Candidatus Thermoplasmatota archaeon]
MKLYRESLLLFFIIILMIFSTGCTESSMDAEEITVTIIKVIDGDTVLASFPNSSVVSIRLLGVDCPETSIQNNYPNEYENITNLSCLTSYGIQAKQVVESLINNSQVTIRYDKQAGKKDQYGRDLCYVTFQSTDLNARLLKEGLARVYTLESFTKKSPYLSFENNAKTQLKGLWNCSESQSVLRISEVHYDAYGNDKYNLNDEYIVLENDNEKPLNLTGWNIRDNHGNQFIFPNGYLLQSKTSITIYTGSGSNQTNVLYWHHQTPVWNNDGDTVFIYNEKNEIIETYSW